MNDNLVEVGANVNLGNTSLEDSASRMVIFNPEEGDEIRGQVPGAALDVQKPEGLGRGTGCEHAGQKGWAEGAANSSSERTTSSRA